ncbi:MAG: YqaE/Pmp3 family membrane protein [Planctomycetota bacterium]
MNLLKIILAIFFPPIAVFLHAGIGVHFWLNILLTLMFGLPGVIHALWLILSDK